MHKKKRFKIFVVFFILSVVYILVFSESGILARRELKNKNIQLNNQIDNLKAGNYKLLQKYEKYRSGAYDDSDIANSGFVYRNGKLIYFDDKIKEKIPSQSVLKDEFSISIEHLRIIWIIISIMYITYYFIKNNRSEESADGSDFNRF